MNFEKLTNWNYLFINCDTTYLQCALSYYAAHNKNDLLLYLADCTLTYNNDVGDCSAQNSKDPFYYQPLKLYNSKKDVLFNDKSFGDFLKFLKTGFNIKTKMIFSPLSKEQLTGNLQDGFKNNEFYIINIDLYYYSYAPLCYNKIHVRHGLLIKAFDIKANTVEVIDTLFPEPVKLNFDEVVTAFNTNTFINSIIKINGNNFANCIDYNERQNAYFKNSTAITFTDAVFADIKEYLYENNFGKYDKDFHLIRYFSAIRYQLLPYLKMRLHLLSINFKACSGQDLKDSIQLWELIADILWALAVNKNDTLCMSSNIEDYNADSIFTMADRLHTLEDNITRDIGKLK